MYERKIPVDLDCPLRLTMSLIDSKWKSCILDELRHRALRPSELHKIFPEALIPIIDAMIAWGEKNTELFEKKYGKR